MTNTTAYRTRRLALWGWVLIATLVVVTLVGAFFAVDAAAAPARSEPSASIVTSEVDGREIAALVYRNDTFGRLDLFRMDSIGYSTQAEAFDLDTGERVWDTLLFAEFGGTEADVLGMGQEYVYITSTEGLLILDAAGGAIVAREGEIAGLGENYIAAQDAYAWDAETEAVVLLDATGTVLSIPVDSIEAVPAPAEVTARWAGELNIGTASGTVFATGQWEQTDHWAPLLDGHRVEPVWAADGWDIDVLLEDGTGLAAGHRSGIAVTQTYQPASRDARYFIEVGELATGRLIGTAEVNDGVWAVTVSDAGEVMMLAGNDERQGLLLVASSDGIRSSVIGERAVLGW